MAVAALQLRLILCPGARGLRSFSLAVRPAAGPRPASRSERSMKRKALPPRTEKMDVDQDWPSVYPVAAPFKPSAVPLPVRMGYPVKKGIPNFLHLTPVAIRRHCAALKDFCTEWPAALDSDEKCEKHFPVEIDTADYVSSGPSVRNPKARVVTLRVKLSSLNLDNHAKKKLIKLVGERYCKTTDVLTITTDRCPLKRQNYDYALYLLTVLYHESWVSVCVEQTNRDKGAQDIGMDRSRAAAVLLEALAAPGQLCSSSFWTDRADSVALTVVKERGEAKTVKSTLFIFRGERKAKIKTEEWEKTKTEEDMEEYVWENSSSENNAVRTLMQIRAAESAAAPSRDQLLGTREVEDYRKSVIRLKNEGENEANLTQYKESVKRLLNLA
ncbi:hypothetical protein U0070_004995 [Myodes glareolus]|uniref:Small ribosomal subunit protein mS35 mitochondrial conserved domain-containing protein n=1 Tax=Myodes glareolus TaxID=447135 RepID=A0AAW0K673_MYOGA